ncbi:UDP-glycosyltransferase 89B2-like protein [Tanacetum coccineum]
MSYKGYIDPRPRTYTEYGHDRVFAIGHLLPSGNNTIERGGSSSRDVLSWLDTCAAKSVLFVSFRSQFVLTNKQIEELALGLETSGVKFLWAVKEPTRGHAAGDYGRILAGFEDWVAGRGLVARGWVPQVAILKHGSVVDLLTHYGWNSIMEAMMVGVLMLTWPISADNFSNASLLHELKIGIKACEGGEPVPDSSDLAQLFRKSVSEETLVERSRAAEFPKLLRPREDNYSERALKGMLLVRVELGGRGIDLDSVLCPSCTNSVESYEFFSSFENVNIPVGISSLWQAVIWTTVYFIWKEMIDRGFGKNVSSTNRIMQDIQLKCYE